MKGLGLSRIKRRIIAFILTTTVAVSSVTPVFAQESVPATTENNNVTKIATSSVAADNINEVVTRAGNETWTGSGFGGSYTFTDYNLTPVKTMGKSGTLIISGSFTGNDGYANASPIKLTVQIRSTSGAVLGSTVVGDDRSGATHFAVTAPVSKGQQIQLYFDASSIANPPGIYRSAHVSYNFAIGN